MLKTKGTNVEILIRNYNKEGRIINEERQVRQERWEYDQKKSLQKAKRYRNYLFTGKDGGWWLHLGAEGDKALRQIYSGRRSIIGDKNISNYVWFMNAILSNQAILTNEMKLPSKYWRPES